MKGVGGEGRMGCGGEGGGGKKEKQKGYKQYRQSTISINKKRIERMNIIIPVGGLGLRFKNANYDKPKPLIKIFEKSMIEYVLDNLQTITEDDRIFIIYSYLLEDADELFLQTMNKKYPDVVFIKLPYQTKGATETLLYGLNKIIRECPIYSIPKKCMVLDCDTFYTEDIVNVFRSTTHNVVFYRKDYKDNNNDTMKSPYSYISFGLENVSNFTEEENDDIPVSSTPTQTPTPTTKFQEIKRIAEKQRISNNANTGCYCFTDIHLLQHYCSMIIMNPSLWKKHTTEPYISCVIDKMIQDGRKFYGYELNSRCVFSLGTPMELEQYKNNTQFFFFDLDGTLVNTDEIYFSVWSKILLRYNISLTEELYEKYIRGNNDNYVVNSIFPNLEMGDMSMRIKEISQEKNRLFIEPENIEKICVVPGVASMFKTIRRNGNKACIVTNCNRCVAVAIMDKIGIRVGADIDFIITSEDFITTPNKEKDYHIAVERYGGDLEVDATQKCIVFEDSKTGLRSGKLITPRFLVGLETTYKGCELVKYGADITIPNFIDFFERFYTTSQAPVILMERRDIRETLITQITEIDGEQVDDIVVDSLKLKGGNIADVVSVLIKTRLNEYSCVFKYENTQTNSLAVMAKRLNLYEREYYVYEKLYDVIKHLSPEFKIPRFIKRIREPRCGNDGVGSGSGSGSGVGSGLNGIVIEKLTITNGFVVNLNLNDIGITTSLKVIDRMCHLHSAFWGKTTKSSALFSPVVRLNDEHLMTFLQKFMKEKYATFKTKWENVFYPHHFKFCRDVIDNYDKLLDKFYGVYVVGDCHKCENNLTLCHGDLKSANIFYDTKNDNEPYFLDFQHCFVGKGVQDLIFFIIESFDLNQMKRIYPMFKNYYYTRLIESKCVNSSSYSYEMFERDIKFAVCLIPFITSIWFGTVPMDELIDKNFPIFFIQKMFWFVDLLFCENDYSICCLISS